MLLVDTIIMLDLIILHEDLIYGNTWMQGGSSTEDFIE